MFEWLLVTVAVVLIAAVVAVSLSLRARRATRRRAELRQHFGPEYERALSEYGSESRADSELAERSKRVAGLEIGELGARQATEFAEAWHHVQIQFVDEPADAVLSANELIKRVMRARGYPIEDFDQRVKDLSVDHPHVVQHYRAARSLASATKQGRASTEELRQAFIHFRALFAELLGEHAAALPSAAQPHVAHG